MCYNNEGKARCVMSNKKYDIFKICVLIVYPALVTCVGTILEALNVDCAGTVVIIMTAINTMLGTIIEKLSSNYKKKVSE
jgi:hypothetical protein